MPGRLRRALALLSILLITESCDRLREPREQAVTGPPRLPTPLVIISVDTLRADRLPVYGYDRVATPAIDELAGDAVIAEHAYAPAPLTMPSHASLLTGLLPPRHGVRDNLGYRFDSAALPYLPRLLRRHGYVTGAAVSAYTLRGQVGFGEGFDLYDDDIPTRARAGLGGLQRSGHDTLSAILPWLRREAGGPFFLFLHLFEPHSPYEPPEPFASAYGDSYDGEVAAADAVVGELLTELRRLRVYRRSVVVLLSDHGEGLGDHGEQEHGLLLYRESLEVPLLLKLPESRLAGTRIETPLQLVDLLPTLLTLLELPVPEGLDGRPFLPPEELPSPERPIYGETYYPRLHFGWSQLTSLIQGSYHFIDGPDPELYDLTRDPEEKRNLVLQQPQATRRLRRELALYRDDPQPPEETPEETRKALTALGYVGSSPRSEGAQLADPKSRLETVEDLREGLRLYSGGDFPGAVVALRRAVEANPVALDAWDYLGRSLTALDRHREAIEAFERAFALNGSPYLLLARAQGLLALGRAPEALDLLDQGIATWPEELAPRLLAARTLARMGRLEEALAQAQALVRQAPDSADAVYLRGALQMGRGALDEAEADLRQALSLAPDHPAAMSDLAVLLRYRGELGEARSLWLRLLEVRPGDEQIQKALADLDRAIADGR